MENYNYANVYLYRRVQIYLVGTRWKPPVGHQSNVNYLLRLKSDDYMRFLIVCSTLNCFEYLAAKRIVCRKAENNSFFAIFNLEVFLIKKLQCSLSLYLPVKEIFDLVISRWCSICFHNLSTSQDDLKVLEQFEYRMSIQNLIFDRQKCNKNFYISLQSK